jgi:hypothetical protein
MNEERGTKNEKWWAIRLAPQFLILRCSFFILHFAFDPDPVSSFALDPDLDCPHAWTV